MRFWILIIKGRLLSKICIYSFSVDWSILQLSLWSLALFTLLRRVATFIYFLFFCRRIEICTRILQWGRVAVSKACRGKSKILGFNVVVQQVSLNETNSDYVCIDLIY